MQKRDDVVVSGMIREAAACPPPPVWAARRLKVCFLLFNLYGIGGTIRSTVNLSGALAEAGHDVEIVSIIRSRETPPLSVHPRVRTVPLVEARKDRPGFDPAHDPKGNPSRVYPASDGPYKHCSALVDERIENYLRDTDADVIIGTRPGVNVYLARFGPARALLVGQEHLTYDMHRPEQRAAQNAAVGRLDAFVTVSRQDARIYREALPDVTTEIRCIPNAVPQPDVSPSSGRNKLVVAAGRLIRIKNYRLLIDAFARVVEQRPDWRLRLYGRGPEARALRSRIHELGLSEQVTMMGAHAPIEPEWAKGSIAAVSSDGESFGMTIVEAMHAGLPVVATDCPFGPGEIISDGVDGLLVQPGNAEEFAAALLELIADDERRAAMAAAARAKALDYAPSAVAHAYVKLFEDLAAKTGKCCAPPEARKKPGGAHALGGYTGTAGHGRALRAGRALARRMARPLLQRPATAVPLLGILRRVSPAAAARADGTARSLRPEARCAVAEDGALVLTFPAAGLTGPADLVLRRRNSAEELRVPLPPPVREGRGGPFRVRLRLARVSLAEGHWEAWVRRRADGALRPVRSTMVERAALVGRAPEVADGAVRSWIPYATDRGRLALRVWQRAVHAEAVWVAVGPSVTYVEAELLGAEPSAEAVVTATRRGTRPTVLRLPATELGAGRFCVLLPHEDFTGRVAGSAPRDREFWDLRLMLPGGMAVRIGRIGGDIVARKDIDTHPSAFRGEGAARARVRPYFTDSNDLALVAAPAPAPDTAAVHAAAPRCAHL
ncbi:glycosyltransferase family 4 protein [Streptomyces purpurogeneiscleroticus]|uniref:glycosyltransferase family 4 protein n=1 Tax=Streptomyces purpurogeneiscleroticus TaxID=68259 RepID=UPI001CBBF3F8|nr:glycosyltransferase family 4 protein [Streptomyces purpurogeneiscleroticus]